MLLVCTAAANLAGMQQAHMAMKTTFESKVRSRGTKGTALLRSQGGAAGGGHLHFRFWESVGLG